MRPMLGHINQGMLVPPTLCSIATDARELYYLLPNLYHYFLTWCKGNTNLSNHKNKVLMHTHCKAVPSRTT